MSLQNFELPLEVTGSQQDRALGEALLAAWRSDGILEVQLTPQQNAISKRAFESSKAFFRRPLAEKSRCISDISYSGYVACREEQTDGKADYSEIFTVCKDVPISDQRVQANWPCHGPVPWPSEDFQQGMTGFMNTAGDIGHRLLQLTALGLGLERDTLANMTNDGWHHMRVLRFQQAETETDRGIGAHTDYGFLVIAVQCDAEGLDVRPPLDAQGQQEARNANWLEGQSTAGVYAQDAHWKRIPLVPGVVTVFPGDLLQYVTGNYLISTPHKVVLHPERERYALAYFHEPNFTQRLTPLLGENQPESILYGRHFTNMFKRCYPDRCTTRRLLAEQREAVLEQF